MSRLYAHPLRVYLSLALVAAAGIFCGTQLPVSLFPNSSKPTVTADINYGSMTAQEFLDSYGRALEDQLHSLNEDDAPIERIKTFYEPNGATFEIQFKWGTSPSSAVKEVQQAMQAFSARMPTEIRDSVQVWSRSENSGFLAVSFYSAKRNLDELYELLEPVLIPPISKVRDQEGAELYNPTAKEIRIELNPERMATLQLLPRDIEKAINSSMTGYGGGTISAGIKRMRIELIRPVQNIDDLKRVSVTTPSGQSVHLSDVAQIELGSRVSQNRVFKTNGAPSLILFATPKAGGNVKRMSEEILAIVTQTMGSLPSDIEYRVLVDPSEFIRSSIRNVLHEVLIGSLLAVGILFLFIGSFRNTVTAAIEIPLSMVLAFLLMRLSGMNLNLISLGGLALSAGMNVDASVVVMENIFRHLEEVPDAKRRSMSRAEKLALIVKAVGEVRFAVIASTLASLVVFLPLAFTSDLTYAVLGDLAKTVVFSHGFSAIVALILVPTVRLHLMSRSEEKPFQSPIEPFLKKLESGYSRWLERFLSAGKLRASAYLSLAALLAILMTAVLPRLPKEIIGKPDTDWLILVERTKGNTLVAQMESQAEETEAKVLKELGELARYTFTQINSPNQAVIMARLRNRKEMRKAQQALQTRFVDTPTVKYIVDTWNPAELPIPNPPDLRVVLRGGSIEERAWATDELYLALEESRAFPRLWTEPNVGREESILLKTTAEQWAALQSSGGPASRLHPSDIADIARIATSGRRIGYLSIKSQPTGLYLRYPQGFLSDPEDLGNLPIGTGAKLLPLRALARVEINSLPPTIYREDGRETFVILGKSEETATAAQKKESGEKAHLAIEKWKKQKSEANSAPNRGPQAFVEDAQKDLTEALEQLGVAVALSVALIFLTLVLQFGDVVSALLVLVSVPLGFIGVLLSLFLFGSTLSLNSVLGVILLNGIAVANSIILVDFLRQRVEQGMDPRSAAIEAAKKRMRPILITSLTTVLGMFPVALGLGEGGKVLQPLGIAVSGGLWVSMGLTLFVVPALQVAYLDARRRRAKTRTKMQESPSATTASSTSWAPLSILLAFGLYSSAQAQEKGAEKAELHFDSALQEIAKRSTTLRSQEAALQSARARTLPLKMAFLPSLSAEAEQSSNSTLDRAGVWGMESSRNVLLTAKLNLFRFGADAAALSAALSDAESENARLDSVKLSEESAAVRALIQRIERAREVGFLQDLVGLNSKAHEIAQQRYARGLLPVQEVDRVSIDLSEAKARLSEAQASEEEARGSLERLLGHDRIVSEWPWKEVLGNEKRWRAILEKNSLELAQLPEWRVAQAKAQSQEERISNARRVLLPSVDARLSYGLTQPLGQDFTRGWSGALSISMPLFDHLSRYSGLQEQRFALTSAEAEKERTQRDAESKWLRSRQSFQAVLRALLEREKILSLSRKLYEDSFKRFQLGRMSANELFTDQIRLIDTELSALQGWAGAHLALTELCHASGKSVLNSTDPAASTGSCF